VCESDHPTATPLGPLSESSFIAGVSTPCAGERQGRHHLTLRIGFALSQSSPHDKGIVLPSDDRNDGEVKLSWILPRGGVFSLQQAKFYALKER